MVCAAPWRLEMPRVLCPGRNSPRANRFVEIIMSFDIAIPISLPLTLKVTLETWVAILLRSCQPPGVFQKNNCASKGSM